MGKEAAKEAAAPARNVLMDVVAFALNVSSSVFIIFVSVAGRDSMLAGAQ